MSGSALRVLAPPLRRITTVLVTASVVAIAMAGLGSTAQSAAAAEAEFPVTVPRISNWQSAGGEAWTLTRDTEIVTDDASQVAANQLADYIAADYGHRPQVRSSGAVDAGDIQLARRANTAPLGAYTISIGNSVVIEGSDASGSFYGAVTVAQALRTTPTAFTLPRGVVSDVPTQGTRGQMIDLGRRFESLPYLRQQIDQMAWYKMNNLHLHLSDWNGYRIESSAHPRVVSADHYTADELRSLDEYAAARGVTIVPEIDLPGHAVQISTAYPELAFTCPSMSKPNTFWEGSDRSGWTLNYTNPAMRSLAKDLIGEVADIFSGPSIHIGGDELPTQNAQQQCPELVTYQQAKGYPYVGDVNIEFINEMNDYVRSLGKSAQLWQWWDFESTTSIMPNKNITIVQWLTDPADRAAQGYTTIGSQDGPLYVSAGFGSTPGSYGFVNVNTTYDDYAFTSGPNIDGLNLSRWMDRSYHLSLDFVDYIGRRPLAVVAERTWAGAPTTSADMLDRYVQVGDSPMTRTDRDPVMGNNIGAAGHGLSKTGWSITATSEETSQDSNAANNAIDNNPYTMWHSQYTGITASLPQSLTIDTGTAHELSAARYLPRQSGGTNGRIKDYRVETSTNGTTWTVSAAGTFPGTPASTGTTTEWSEQLIPFTQSTTARYVRFTALSEYGTSNAFSAVAEFDLFTDLPELPALPTAGPTVEASVTSRCVGGKAILTVRALNTHDAATAIELTTPYGTKTFASIDSGKNALHAFTTRVADLPRGQVTVKSSATVDGQPRTTTLTAAYEALTCGS
ncbi:family 20 glycosylhydrolase [Arthrobacter sp. 35W]|uniref:family 20 glycosylhydrolase n=1 Tax=Arthrobacter sp. 35W TaxID=1132441 RepID=UPI000402DC7F|nr:family 20 glycosylhydrolase [Arthrobacter sp. 35W]